MGSGETQAGSATGVTYVLIPGAGGRAWYWHRLADQLEARGHDVVAVDLPAADDTAGFSEYADAVVEAVGGRGRLHVVGQSLGAFTAALVCTRVPVDLLVLLNAMVPLPGESPGDWWAATGFEQARAEHAAPGDEADDGFEVFFHDVPEHVRAEAIAGGEPLQSDAPFTRPWPLDRWPSVPTRALVARDDRFFPAAFQQRVLRERLGIAGDEMPGGHLVALSRPDELADRLEGYRAAMPVSAARAAGP